MSRKAIEELSASWQKDLLHEKGVIATLAERFSLEDPSVLSDLEMGLVRIPEEKYVQQNIYTSLKSFGIMDETLSGMVSIPLRKKGVISNFLFLNLNGEHDNIIRTGGIIHYKAIPVFKRIVITDNLTDFFAYFGKVKQNIIPVIESGMPADLKNAFGLHGTEEVIYINESPYYEQMKGLLAATEIKQFTVTLPDGMSLLDFTNKFSSNKVLSYIEAEKAKRIKERVEKDAVAATDQKSGTSTKLSTSNGDSPKDRSGSSSSISSGSAGDAENSDPTPEYLTMTEGTGEVIFTGTDRKYQVRGFNRDGFEKIVQLCLYADERAFPDKVDLSRSQGRLRFAGIAGAEFEMSSDMIRNDLAYIYKKLDSMQDERFKEKSGIANKNIHISTPDDITKAKNKLTKRDLLTEILITDCEKLGYIEERINKILFYLAGISRLTGEPLSLLDISPPGTGKSFGMSTVMGLMPPDEVLKYSRLTPNALYYRTEDELKGKVLFIEEIVGMENSLEALRMLISSGELAVSGVEKDPRTGQLRAVERRIRADIPVISTGVRDIFDEETLSRFILTYNETTDEHMKRVMKAQGHRYSLDGERAKHSREKIQEIHWHMQRSLDPNLKIINPFHDKVQVNVKLPIAARKNMQYLRLMHNIAFTRQHSREKKTDTDRFGNTFSYIEVTTDDLRTANSIASYVFRYAASDLTLRQQDAYNNIFRFCGEMVKDKKITANEYRFSRREIRENYGWDAATAKRLFDELEKLEYIRKTSGVSQGMRYQYQLVNYGERKSDDRGFTFLDPNTL